MTSQTSSEKRRTNRHTVKPIPLIAPDPVLSTSSYECQRSGEQIDPLQTSDPWLSFHSGPGSQQALRDALWELMVLLLHSWQLCREL